MPAPVTAYIGLGSNLGDREQQIAQALERLARVPGVKVLATSRLRETDPVGGPPQPRYCNGVCKVLTTLPAAALLALLQQLERDAGRTPSAVRNSPRVLDLDLLLYGDAPIDTKDLVVPHPRLFARPFVTEPLRELGVDLATVPRVEPPRVVHDPRELAALCAQWRAGGCTLGLVPTMGALHAGHASLLQTARRECDRVLGTIFVNPLQFGPGEDYSRYPRTLAADLALLRASAADAVFVPERSAMYGEGFCSQIAVGAAAEGMEGAARPGHFSGVATVVAKLFALTAPTHAYFGRKDAQQVAVLRRMTQDLGFPLRIRECAIVREPSGLALSSRNVFLSAEDRQAAGVLFAALSAARRAHAAGERRKADLLALAREMLAAEPRASLEYLELRSEPELLPLPDDQPVERGRMLVVARFGTERPTRLLDNLALCEADDA